MRAMRSGGTVELDEVMVKVCTTERLSGREEERRADFTPFPTTGVRVYILDNGQLGDTSGSRRTLPIDCVVLRNER